MRNDKIAQKLSSSETNETTLRSLAREVGHELVHEFSRKRLAELRKFRQMLARTPLHDRHQWRIGYRAALLDVVAAFDDSISERLDRIEASKLIREKNWVHVLKVLQSGLMTREQLMTAIHEHDEGQEHLLKQIDEMQSAHLIEFVRNVETQDFNCQLTLRGEQLLREVLLLEAQREDLNRPSHFEAILARWTTLARGLHLEKHMDIEAIFSRYIEKKSKVEPSNSQNYREGEKIFLDRGGIFSEPSLNHPLISMKHSNFKGLQSRQPAEIPFSTIREKK